MQYNLPMRIMVNRLDVKNLLIGLAQDDNFVEMIYRKLAMQSFKSNNSQFNYNYMNQMNNNSCDNQQQCYNQNNYQSKNDSNR